jgi:hypothetical protein
MTCEQYHEKCLLDYRSELEGMISENRQRELNQFSPAYNENDFARLSANYETLIRKY